MCHTTFCSPFGLQLVDDRLSPIEPPREFQVHPCDAAVGIPSTVVSRQFSTQFNGHLDRFVFRVAECHRKTVLGLAQHYQAGPVHGNRNRNTRNIKPSGLIERHLSQLETRMLHRLLFGLSFAFSGVIATTGHAYAAFDPDREELIGIMAAVVGISIATLTLIYAVKWYAGWDRQDPDSKDLHDYLSGHH